MDWIAEAIALVIKGGEAKRSRKRGAIVQDIDGQISACVIKRRNNGRHAPLF